MNWYKLSSPKAFYPVAGKIAPYFLFVTGVLLLLGLCIAFFWAPTDFQQGEAYRIIFVHVPAAWMSMFIYLIIALWSIVGLSLNSKLSFMMAQALAPTGAIFTFLALVTGSLWGKPMWGAWWVWDARLTSELILLFLYAGYMSLNTAFDNVRRSDRAAAIFAVVSAINIPIIYFSVRWWNTLHQGASVSFIQAPSMASIMLLGMLVMALSFWTYTIGMALLRLRCIIAEREREMVWVNDLQRSE